MKKILFFFSFLLIHHFARSQSAGADSCFHPDSLRAIVEMLASDSMQGRLAGSGNDLSAARYISLQFAAALEPVSDSGYYVPVKNRGYNLIGMIRGRSKPAELVLFSAHYDHIGTKRSPKLMRGLPERGKPEKGDTIYNGANDDASGVAVLIALARYYSQLQNNERTLLFAAFSFEEWGLLGSQQFAPLLQADSIIAVVNLEMIGREGSRNKTHPYITGAGESDFIRLLNKRLHAANNSYGRKYFHEDPYYDEHLFERSDNYPFAQRGIPAHTIMLTSPADKYYHSLNDEAWTLDFPLMSQITKAIALATAGLVSGEDTPSRIRQ